MKTKIKLFWFFGSLGYISAMYSAISMSDLIKSDETLQSYISLLALSMFIIGVVAASWIIENQKERTEA